MEFGEGVGLGTSTGGGAEEGSGPAGGEAGEAAVGASSSEPGPEAEELSSRWMTVLHRRLWAGNRTQRECDPNAGEEEQMQWTERVWKLEWSNLSVYRLE